ncbi:MAG: hypothetical protein RIS70_4023 [Planctomycetota bacterium]
MPRFLRPRKGNILVLSAFMMIMVMGLLAFSIDLGYLYVSRDQMQRSADAAAIAACWDLVDTAAPAGYANTATTTTKARVTAAAYASMNKVLNNAPTLGENDVTVGYLANPSDPSTAMVTSGAFTPNAVNVRVQRSSSQNGSVPLFFGRVFGLSDLNMQTDATAAILTSVKGFTNPSTGGNLDILPFALDEETWGDLLAGGGTDQWSYDTETAEVLRGSDGIRECNLYPQGTGAPGNRGTVDIGGQDNSTRDIARQIVSGVNSADLAHHGGSIQLNSSGVLYLNGDTGISAGVMDELVSIVGKPRIVPVFRSVTNPGNNATYSIVKFCGIRIVDVDLRGSISSKRVMIQPANIVTRGGIYSEIPSSSTFIYSPVWLVR